MLLLENVPELIGSSNVKHFAKWLDKLETFGYTSFYQILNAKDYGIPQNRRRVFCVSILNDYAYDFPLKIKLKYRLKDFLEKQVDEKYYLTEKMVDYVLARTPLGDKEFKSANNIRSATTDKTAGTITTKGSGTGSSCRGEDTFIVDDMSQQQIDTMIYGKDSAGMKLIKVGNYGNGHHAKDVIDSDGLSTTITTGNHGPRTHNESIALNTIDRPSVKMNLRIRKLVPVETTKLMGFERKDYQAMRDIGQSDSQIYHCCGDSIVVTCLMAIFGQMLFDEKTLKEKIENYVESVKDG